MNDFNIGVEFEGKIWGFFGREERKWYFYSRKWGKDIKVEKNGICNDMNIILLFSEDGV